MATCPLEHVFARPRVHMCVRSPRGCRAPQPEPLRQLLGCDEVTGMRAGRRED